MERSLLRLPVLPREFYSRATVDVARDLLGQIVVLPPCAGRIVEVEAYLGLDDQAAHASRGLTDRTKVIFGPPGHAYVYFIYGMYECLNLVAEPAGTPGCVLIRAVEPIAGLDAMRLRRAAARADLHLCSGPGKLTRAFDITRKFYGCDVTAGPLTVRESGPVPRHRIAAGPRIGIRRSAELPLRFWIDSNPFVSRAR